MPKKPDSRRHLDDSTRSQVENLLARTPDHGLVRTAATKNQSGKSCLDPFKLDILERHSKGVITELRFTFQPSMESRQLTDRP